jgi:hypothetical protein
MEVIQLVKKPWQKIKSVTVALKDFEIFVKVPSVASNKKEYCLS